MTMRRAKRAPELALVRIAVRRLATLHKLPKAEAGGEHGDLELLRPPSDRCEGLLAPRQPQDVSAFLRNSETRPLRQGQPVVTMHELARVDRANDKDAPPKPPLHRPVG